jgi:Ca2+-transporting ATPase
MAVVYIPFLQPVFNTVPLGWAQWKLILPMVILPSIAAELIKFIFGRRANLKG